MLTSTASSFSNRKIHIHILTFQCHDISTHSEWVPQWQLLFLQVLSTGLYAQWLLHRYLVAQFPPFLPYSFALLSATLSASVALGLSLQSLEYISWSGYNRCYIQTGEAHTVHQAFVLANLGLLLGVTDQVPIQNRILLLFPSDDLSCPPPPPPPQCDLQFRIICWQSKY